MDKGWIRAVESLWEGAVAVLVGSGFFRQTSRRWIEVRAEPEDLRMYGDLCDRWIEQLLRMCLDYSGIWNVGATFLL
jgi:hypothetical protein